MNITTDTAVTMSCRIANGQGQLLQDGKQPQVYLHGGHDNTFPKVEAALEGKAVGDTVQMTLAPADAFGEPDPALVRTLPKREFPPGVKVGGVLELPDDSGQMRGWRVVKVKGDTVHLDGNHALAGQTLRLSIKVLAVRPATAEEIAHGHVHGEHGHHH